MLFYPNYPTTAPIAPNSPALAAPMMMPDQYIWHIGIIMQALTSTDRAEILQCLSCLATTHAGTNFMHESFDKDHPETYTRSWFAWANSLFATLMVGLMEEDFFGVI